MLYKLADVSKNFNY